MTNGFVALAVVGVAWRGWRDEAPPVLPAHPDRVGVVRWVPVSAGRDRVFPANVASHCKFDFAVESLPNSPFYQVHIDGEALQTVSATELEESAWNVAVNSD